MPAAGTLQPGAAEQEPRGGDATLPLHCCTGARRVPPCLEGFPTSSRNISTNNNQLVFTASLVVSAPSRCFFPWEAKHRQTHRGELCTALHLTSRYPAANTQTRYLHPACRPWVLSSLGSPEPSSSGARDVNVIANGCSQPVPRASVSICAREVLGSSAAAKRRRRDDALHWSQHEPARGKGHLWKAGSACRLLEGRGSPPCLL